MANEGTTTTTETPAAPPAGGAPPAAPAAGGGGEPQWDPQTRSYIEGLRSESAGYRTKAKTLEDQIKTLQPALKQWEDIKKMLSGEGAPADPIAALKEKDSIISQKDAHIKEMRIMGDISEKIAGAGLEPKGAKHILKGTLDFAALDPDSADYSKTLDGAIKKIGEDFAYLKVQASGPVPPVKPPTTRSGNPTQPPGPGAGPDNQMTREQLQGMKPEDVVKAFNEGKLNTVLGRK